MFRMLEPSSGRKVGGNFFQLRETISSCHSSVTETILVPPTISILKKHFVSFSLECNLTGRKRVSTSNDYVSYY